MRISFSLLKLLTLFFIFWIPFDRAFDRQLGSFSLGMIPEDLFVPDSYQKKISLHLSDLLLPLLCFLGIRVSMLWQHGALALWAFLLCAIASLLSSAFAGYPIPYFHLWAGQAGLPLVGRLLTIKRLQRLMRESRLSWMKAVLA